MNLMRAMFLALTAALAMSSHAFAQGGNACPRPAAGSAVAQPGDLFSANGVLSVDFGYFTSVDAFGRTLFCFVTPAGRESPTLHVNPGDTIKIKLTNKLPSVPGAPSEVVSSSAKQCGSLTMTVASVNMHFHGTNVSPTCHSDEVIHTLVNPNETFTYELDIPKDEPPGLYWYHPHVHGIASAAVEGGASGMIEVEGIANIQPVVAGLPQRFLIVRDQPLTGVVPTLGRSVTKGTQEIPFWDLSLNYVPVSYPQYQTAIIKMQPGKKEFWRVVNASANTLIDLQIRYDGVPQPLQIVAFDGVPTGSQDGRRQGTVVTQTDVMLMPASRAEFVVTAPAANVSVAKLFTLQVDTGPGGDNTPFRPLATIETTKGPTDLLLTATQTGAPHEQRFEGLADAKVTKQRHLYFSEYPGNDSETTAPPGSTPPEVEPPFHFYITVVGQQRTLFDPNEPPAIITRRGAVEEWTIQNTSYEIHAFHMHQIHFLVEAVNGVPIPKNKQQFYDTFPVPPWSGKGRFSSIKVKMDFRGAVVGDFVYHCHILQHEDGGMMAIIRVRPAKA
jgi:FtsP/CotA-like multicopper oxidase with cupredoxin domain